MRSDDELYAECRRLGGLSREAIRKFSALIPEVVRRGLYKKKGFSSMSEFVKKLAGMSEYTLDKILAVSRRVEFFPSLKELFESGEQGWSKIEKVLSVATVENEKIWAERVSRHSARMLEALVRGERRISHVSKSDGRGEFSQEGRFVSFSLSEDVEKKLRLFKQSLEKDTKQPLVWDQAIKKLLDEDRELEGKQVVLKVCPDCARRKGIESSGRYIPTEVRAFLKAKFRGTCGFPNCKLPSEFIHHTKRFSLVKNHDPEFMVPLCKKHHDMAHTGLIQNEEGPPETWTVGPSFQTAAKSFVDAKFMQIRGSPQ